MIRKTLKTTKPATFIVHVSDPQKGTLIPNGTCFFISKDGYILTAYHVVKGFEAGPIDLVKPVVPHWEDPNWATAITLIQHVTLVEAWEEFDLALLKADFEANSEKDWARARDGFPWLPVSFEEQEEGTPVYTYGYPLSDYQEIDVSHGIITLPTIRDRTTSAIIASTREEAGPFMGPRQPKHYVLDKALNYGNSGGPVVLTESGKAISVAVRFQPFAMRQPQGGLIVLPSLYSISSSLKNIETQLRPLLQEGQRRQGKQSGRTRRRKRKRSK